jgi:hypothetical protein
VKDLQQTLCLEPYSISIQQPRGSQRDVVYMYWLTISALVYEPKCGGRGECCGVLAYEYSCAHGAQINFVDLTQYI